MRMTSILASPHDLPADGRLAASCNERTFGAARLQLLITPPCGKRTCQYYCCRLVDFQSLLAHFAKAAGAAEMGVGDTVTILGPMSGVL
jgi:hypothetical protein